QIDEPHSEYGRRLSGRGSQRLMSIGPARDDARSSYPHWAPVMSGQEGAFGWDDDCPMMGWYITGELTEQVGIGRWLGWAQRPMGHSAPGWGCWDRWPRTCGISIGTRW